MIGVPYARAGVNDQGEATSTCPTCGDVFAAVDHKTAARSYARHYDQAHETRSMMYPPWDPLWHPRAPELMHPHAEND